MLILLIPTQKLYFCDNDAFMTEPVKNDVITTDTKSTGIHLLNNYSLRPSQSFSFLDKVKRPYLPFVALALITYLPVIELKPKNLNYCSITLISNL